MKPNKIIEQNYIAEFRMRRWVNTRISKIDVMDNLGEILVANNERVSSNALAALARYFMNLSEDKLVNRRIADDTILRLLNDIGMSDVGDEYKEVISK